MQFQGRIQESARDRLMINFQRRTEGPSKDLLGRASLYDKAVNGDLVAGLNIRPR